MKLLHPDWIVAALFLCSVAAKCGHEGLAYGIGLFMLGYGIASREARKELEEF